ncbi:nicotinamide-nucleotide amidohydrolase family protein [Bifidobacterium sp. ESL0763]|uniref:CinA family protein n=1 Tax=Bifidobacterium sp. ESL0763 TaxID=2983227 RepID=UPI002476360F
MGVIDEGDIAGIERECDAMAARVLEWCRGNEMRVASAESLTGGLLADAFVRIPGASDVFLGSAVTYDIAAKASLLGVDAGLLKREGAVHPEVACQMAQSTADLYDQPEYHGRVIGLSTTGVAGPGPDGDKPAGLVYIGVRIPPCVRGGAARAKAFELRLSGSRERIRRLTVLNVLYAVTRLTVMNKE